MSIAVQRYVTVAEYATLDEARLLAVVEKYVSFFDYALALPKEQLYFPKRSVVRLGVPYTFNQARLLMRLMSPKDTLDAGTRELVGMQPSDDPLLADTFFKYARSVANIGDNAARYDAVWDKTQKRWVARAKEMKVVAATVAASGIPVSSDAKLKPFECPKFAAVAQLLLEHAVKSDPRKQFAAPPTKRFLPVVYSSFESGFAAFGAYLTAHGLPYVCIREVDSPEERGALLTEAIKEYACITNVRAARSAPVCVLLHPSITEGLSFTNSPAIIVLETINGFGTQEQVYARILRRYRNPFSSDDERPVKTIYQFAGEYPLVSKAKVGGIYEYLWQSGGGLTSSWQVSAWRTQFDVSTPELSIALKNKQQEDLINTLGKAFMTRDDAVQGGVCEAESGVPSCRVCLQGTCNCVDDEEACFNQKL